MKLREMKLVRFLYCVSALGMTYASAQNIEVKAYKTRLSDVMSSIGTQSNKKVILNTDENPLISFGSKETDLETTLKKIENLYGYSFEVKSDTIMVNKPNDKKSGRGIATSDDPDATAAATPEELRESGYRFRSINMNFKDPAVVLKQIQNIAGTEIKFLETDDKNKAIVFYGDEQVYRMVRQIIDDVDVPEPQILLAAKIIEATTNFSRDLGVTLSRQAGTDKGNFGSSPASVSGALSIGYKFGIIDSTGLDVALKAGESNGDAKTLSSPQVITSDNVAANISSDNTINIKIGTVGSSSGDSSDSTAGSLQSVSAGLTLGVTPKVLRDGKVRLKIDIKNSQFDNTTVDGIPGQTSTSVKTEMIVRTGQTAAIAGLFKKQDSDKSGGVPLAMNVPIFGWLFKSNSKSDTRQEVMAFITPAILDAINERSISLDSIKEETKKEKLSSSR